MCFHPLENGQVTAYVYMYTLYIELNSSFVLLQKEIHNHWSYLPRIFLAQNQELSGPECHTYDLESEPEIEKALVKEVR